MRHSLRHYHGSPLMLALAIQISPPAFGDDLDAFAARLLCQTADCPPTSQPEPPPPLVIEGITLPTDAARQRDDEQAFLVRQGAYLTEQGAIDSLADTATAPAALPRGQLQAPDHGPANLLPTTGPVIITTPTATPQGRSRD